MTDNVDLEERRARLSPAKQALLKKRLQGVSMPEAEPGVIPRRAAQATTALSFAQERMWFLDQWEPGNSAFNRPVVLRLTGRLDAQVLERTLSEIVRRHEILRATFRSVDGQPSQVIVPAEPLDLVVTDISEVAPAERELKARELATAEARHPLNLARGPIFRATLLRLDEEDHVLVFVVHHIAFDAWSAMLFRRELAVIYEAFSAGQTSPLAELSIQYADYALWQRDRLQGGLLETQIAYWKQQLDGVPFALELPTDSPRPPRQSYRGACEDLLLPDDLTRMLAGLSKEQNASLFMVLLAAFKLLLYRLTGETDVVVGTPIAGRSWPEIEGLIGMFVNNLVLRGDLSGHLTFLDLLYRIREMTLAAYDRQELPFEVLVEELRPERDPSRTPFFQIYFNMHPSERHDFALPGLRIEQFELGEYRSNFDLTVYIRQLDGSLHVRFTYNVDLFSRARMAGMLAQFRYLLEQIVARPEQSIKSYSLVTPESRALVPDPTMALTEPQQELITSMVTSWAERIPYRTAISQGEKAWSYTEVVGSARHLARALLAQGLDRGDVVAVLGLQSFGLIASMLGVFLSGGVLLPMDRNLPRQRQRLMLREARAKVLVSVGDERSGEDAWWEEESSLGTLLVDAARGCIKHVDSAVELEALPLPDLCPDDPAYIFFTSGSSGVPKGVLGNHKGMSHFLSWQRHMFAIGPQDRAAQLTGLSFDAVLRDIFLALVSGATLCLPEEPDGLGPGEVLSWLEREQITIVHVVPSVAKLWLAEVPADASLRAMRWLFFSGEPLTDTLVDQWRSAFCGGGEILNLYGPTETTMTKCFYQVPASPSHGVQPLGWPMPQTQGLVLTEENLLCGIGEPGEIVLRTPFRTLGYINAPEDNQKRFVKSPFCDDEADVLYYTGDRGRYRPDGMLEILGRLDDQVKIRGVRVEPDEVSATLARHPAVDASAVVSHKDRQHEAYLAAYVVPSKRHGVTAHQLRSYLARQLPASLVPTAFVFLEQLPLTATGKLDRRALPVPDWSDVAAEQAFVAPRTPTEAVLAGIWARILGVEQVGIHDDFFELGGHSLLATQVVSRIRDSFRVALPLRSLFETPTVAGLAELLETIIWAAQGPDDVRESGGGRHEEGKL